MHSDLLLSHTAIDSLKVIFEMYYYPDESLIVLNKKSYGHGNGPNMLRPLLVHVVDELVLNVDLLINKIDSLGQNLAVNYHMIPVYLYKYYASTLIGKVKHFLICIL